MNPSRSGFAALREGSLCLLRIIFLVANSMKHMLAR